MSYPRSKRSGVHVGAAAALVLAMAASVGGASRAFAAEKTSLLLDWTWWPPHVGIMHAYHRGYYKEAGLALELRQGNGSGSTVAAVSQGTYELGISDIPVAAQAIAKGANLKVVATLSQKNGIGVVFKTSAGIKTPKDLEGKKFGSTPTGFDAQLYPAFFKANNIDASKVQIVNMPGEAKLTALLTGQTDVVIGNAFYYAAIAQSKGADVALFTLSDHGVNLLGYGIVANGDVLKSKPDVVRKVIAATLRGYQETLKNMDVAVESYLTVSGLKEDRSLVAGIYKNFQGLLDSPDTRGKPMGINSKTNWEDTLRNLRTYLGMSEGKAAEDFFTNDYLPK